MTQQPLVSFCIAAAKYNRSGEYLERLLKTIASQTWKDYEIVISDHDDGNETSEIISKSLFVDLSIKYVRFGDKKGFAAANLNNAIKHANGKYIKLMFTDDYLIGNDSLMKMIMAIRDKKWLAVGCQHCNDNGGDLGYYHPPGWDGTTNMAHGHNLIGSPSVVMFEKDGHESFDENLRYYNDCEMYFRMGRKFGPPVLLNEPLVYIRLSDHGVSSLTTEEDKMREHRYIDVKYGAK